MTDTKPRPYSLPDIEAHIARIELSSREAVGPCACSDCVAERNRAAVAKMEEHADD